MFCDYKSESFYSLNTVRKGKLQLRRKSLDLELSKCSKIRKTFLIMKTTPEKVLLLLSQNYRFNWKSMRFLFVFFLFLMANFYNTFAPKSLRLLNFSGIL